MYRNWNHAYQKQGNIQINFLTKQYAFGILFVLFGFFIFFLPSFIKTYTSYVYPLIKNYQYEASVNKSFKKNVVASVPPTSIVIPSVGIDLPIVEAKIVNGYWELSDTTASHGVGSSNPGQKGNMVIFAHARIGLFLPLKNIEENAIIYVYAKKKKYTYKVKKINFVTPDEIQYISQTQDNRLTLFTCSGLFDEKRMIVEAKPVRF